MKTTNAQLKRELNETNQLLAAEVGKRVSAELAAGQQRGLVEGKDNHIRHLQQDIDERNRKIQSALNSIRSTQLAVIDLRAGPDSAIAIKAVLGLSHAAQTLGS